MLSSLLAKKGLAEELASIKLTKETEERYPDEPILRSNTKRFVLFPIQWDDLWQAYKHVEAKFWGAEEIKLTDDADDWSSGKLSKQDRNIINRCLTLMASEPALLQGDLTESLIQTFSEEVQTLEARCMYGYMMQARNIYRELFSLCLQEYAGEYEDRKKMFVELRDNMPSLKATTEWIKQYALDQTLPFSDRNVALACWHYLHNSTIFALLFHLHNSPASMEAKALPKMSKDGHQVPRALPGLVHGLEKVHADMIRYFEYDELINAHLIAKPNQEFVHKVVAKAVELETQMIKELLDLCANGEPVKLAGELVSPVEHFAKFVQARADHLLAMFGCPNLYSANDNPLQWIETTVAEHEPDQKAPSKSATPSKVLGSPSMKSPMSATPKSAGMAGASREVFTLDADF